MDLSQKPFGQIVLQIEEVARLIDGIAAVASSRVPALIMGPRSTGVDLVAQAMHTCSPRSARPFMTVRCNANHGTLLDFQFSPGGRNWNDPERPPARGRAGNLESTNGGTLFIDQVQSATPPVQLELLRLIADQEYLDPARGEVQRTDLRLVLSAWIGLERRCDRGEFRRDLYERINMVTLEVRRGFSTKEWFFEVVGLLREVVLGRAAHSQLSPALIAEINRYSWSPQVRSLQDAIRAFVRQGDDFTQPEEVFFQILRTIGHRRAEDLAQHNLQAVSSAVERCVDTYEFFEGHMYETLIGQMQRALIRRTLIQCNGVLARAASVLGVSINLLESKVQELGLQ
ncbi:MAG: sigma 54-interacting transcriptional regulator [Phycisphaerae bacterium]